MTFRLEASYQRRRELRASCELTWRVHYRDSEPRARRRSPFKDVHTRRVDIPVDSGYSRRSRGDPARNDTAVSQTRIPSPNAYPDMIDLNDPSDDQSIRVVSQVQMGLPLGRT
jgi:hypothetical protein